MAGKDRWTDVPPSRDREPILGTRRHSIEQIRGSASRALPYIVVAIVAAAAGLAAGIKITQPKSMTFHKYPGTEDPMLSIGTTRFEGPTEMELRGEILLKGPHGTSIIIGNPSTLERMTRPFRSADQ